MKLVVLEQKENLLDAKAYKATSKFKFKNGVVQAVLNLGTIFRAEQLENKMVSVSLFRVIGENEVEPYETKVITDNEVYFQEPTSTTLTTTTFKLVK